MPDAVGVAAKHRKDSDPVPENEGDMRRFDAIIAFHEAISYILKPMTTAPEVEVQNLRNAIQSAKRGVEILEKALVEAEAKLEP